MKWIKTKEEIATLLLILCAFNSGVRLFKNNFFLNRKTISKDMATLSEEGLRGLKEMLPERGVVGFVLDDFLSHEEKYQRFYLTRYALAPTLVTFDQTQDLVITDFKEAPTLKEWIKGKPFVIVKDFKNGIALLRKEPKK